MTTDLNEEEIIQQIIVRMTDKNPTVPAPTIESLVREEFGGLAGRPVQDYLSVLTERAVKKRLKKDNAA